MKHTTIALFVPHRGCPHRCSFCNQKSISGESRSITAQDVENAVKTAVKNPAIKNAEIAFFGGSFSAIDREYMLSLLTAGHKFIDNNKICGIRVSTRPDALDGEICAILKNYGVTAVELGAQ
ncbi:MAG: radical SAM protein, partial [Clostridia bacterium]|nr:radical SAM protein [Clostridia bacterium]